MSITLGNFKEFYKYYDRVHTFEQTLMSVVAELFKTELVNEAVLIKVTFISLYNCSVKISLQL